MEQQGLEDSLLYSEATQPFGMAQYRMKVYPLADGALRFAYKVRTCRVMAAIRLVPEFCKL